MATNAAMRDHAAMQPPHSPYPATLPPAPGHVVSASNLVRHFGQWQEHAARNPVYVQIHGRPRLVLLAIDTLTTLCAQPASIEHAPCAVDAGPLLDTIADMVLIADQAGTISATSRAARLHFGMAAAIGQSILGIAPVTQHALLSDTLQRVLRSGTPLTIRFASSARATRRLAMTVTPMGRGAALIGTDDSVAHDAALRCAVASASGEAMRVTGCAATAVVDRAGHILEPGAALVALTGMAADVMRQRPLSSIFAAPTRAGVAAMTDRVFARHQPAETDAILLREHDKPLKMRIGLAPVWQDGSVERIVAMLVAR